MTLKEIAEQSPQTYGLLFSLLSRSNLQLWCHLYSVLGNKEDNRFINPVYYTDVMARKKTLVDEKRVEFLLPNKLLDQIDMEAKSRNTNRSETLRRILQSYFDPQSTLLPTSTPKGESTDLINSRLDEINDKLNRIHARLKIAIKRSKR